MFEQKLKKLELELEITVPQLECVAGCSFLSTSFTTLTCHSLSEEQEQLVMTTTTIHLSGIPYHCYPPTKLPQQLLLQLHSLDCQFCDSLEQLLVQSSCKLKYSLAKMDSQGWYETGLACVLVVILAILLVMFFREFKEAAVVVEADSLHVGEGEAVACEEFSGRGERSREEEIFRQGHSWLGGKRRGRSRSKRRV